MWKVREVMTSPWKNSEEIKIVEELRKVDKKICDYIDERFFAPFNVTDLQKHYTCVSIIEEFKRVLSGGKND